MWAARDKFGLLYIYVKKPVKYLDDYWFEWSKNDSYFLKDFDIDDSAFEHVTFENSPVEFKLKPIFNE